MQPINARAGSLDYDLGNTDLWEYVFIDPRSKPADGKPGEDDQKPDEDAGHGDDDDEDEGNLLDLPPSWVSKLELSRSDFKLRYPPDGARTTLYHRAKLELFAENLDDQGLVSRLLKYDDDERTAVVECVEKFKHRRDKLHRRRRFPTEAKLVEEFLPGRPGALAILTEKAGRRRELAFHHAARQDGLVSRTDDIGEKIVEIYKGRPDRLVYRAAAVTRDRAAGSAKVQYTLPGGEASGDLVVKKMTQKFDRNPTAEATGDAPRPRGDDDPSRKRPRAQSDASILRENASSSVRSQVQKRSFYVHEGRIETKFHYADLAVTRKTRTHYKDRTAAEGAAAAADDDAPKAGEATLTDVLAAERDCLAAVRRSQLEVLDLLKLRRREETTVVVDRPVFETARERRNAGETAGATATAGADASARAVDYLTPFLQHVPDLAGVSYDDAQRARDSCLKSLKERLVERANIITTRLNDENAKLAKKQASFQRNQRDNDPAAEEEFERFCSEAMFRVQILEQRLASHEETALKKFQDLDEKLCADPRLRILQE